MKLNVTYAHLNTLHNILHKYISERLQIAAIISKL